MKKSILLLGLLFSLMTLLAFPTEATDVKTNEEPVYESVPDEYHALLEQIPPDLLDLFPSTLFSDKSEDIGDAAREMSSFSYLLTSILSLLGLRLGSATALLATVCGILILSAVFRAFQASIRSEQIEKAVSTVSTLAILVTILSQGYLGISTTAAYFTKLNGITSALIPLTGVLYAMGGNVSAAVASSSGLSIYMTLTEQLIGRSILPFCGIIMAFGMMNAIDPAIRLGTLSATVKKNYTTFLAFLMMLLSAMLAAQTVLGNTGDSIAMRSAKFAVGNIIPVVGGSVSELLRTVSAGISYLRSSVGVCALVILLLTVLPTLVELLLVRLVWQIASSLGDLLGCEKEKKLLDEMTSLSGYLITAVAICSSVLFLSLSLLIHSATAYGT